MDRRSHAEFERMDATSARACVTASWLSVVHVNRRKRKGEEKGEVMLCRRPQQNNVAVAQTQKAKAQKSEKTYAKGARAT